MNRRESVAILMALAASPSAGFAQQAGRTYRLGMMTGNARADWAQNDPYVVSFVQRLGELGFVEGRNLVIEHRATAGQADRLALLATELARLNCDVLVVSGPEDRLDALERATPRYAHCCHRGRLRPPGQWPHRQPCTPGWPDHRHHASAVRAAGKARRIA
jgi:putative tryptophan/tyrosine transport system substrate-binding protein